MTIRVVSLHKFYLFLLVITSILFCTSLPGVPVPLFVLAIMVYIIGNIATRANIKIPKDINLVAIFMILLLCQLPFVTANSQIAPSVSLNQFVARFMFILVIPVLLGLKKVIPLDTQYELKIVTLLFAYGIYEFIAKLYSLPLFLSFLINNNSYTNTLLVTSVAGGWADLYRSQSVWAEPSFSMFPVLLFLFAYHKRENKSKIQYLIMLAYTILTFSRSVYGVVLIFYFVLFFLYLTKRFNIITRSIAITLTVFGVLVVVTAKVTYFAGDLSAKGRSEAIIAGLDIIREHPIIGIGFNSFSELHQFYQVTESVIHNSYINYLASAGVFGLCILLFLFYKCFAALVSSYDPNDFPVRLAAMLSFISCGFFISDFLYSAISWYLLFKICFDDNRAYQNLYQGGSGPCLATPLEEKP